MQKMIVCNISSPSPNRFNDADANLENANIASLIERLARNISLFVLSFLHI